MTNITYLLGAGASANCLPTINGIKDELDHLYQAIKEYIYEASSGSLPEDPDFRTKHLSDDEYVDRFRDLLLKTKWLKEVSSEHATVDTLAKKLFLTNEPEKLKDLKYVLSILFSILQVNKSLDIRYDSILAGLLQIEDQTKIRLPQNIKFITWNYDIQLELAITNYLDPGQLSTCQRLINSFPRSTDNSNENINNPSIVHLNGIAGFFHKNGAIGHLYRHMKIDKIKALKEILDIISEFGFNPSNLNNIFTFSWENSSIAKQSIDFANSIMNQTEVLVVIGYSFPFFNREVDRKLISRKINLKKIYYQDNNPDMKFPIQQFDLHNVKVEHVGKIPQFFIPHEL